MEPVLIVALLTITCFAGASFFFSLAETALFSLSKWQIRQLGETSQPRGPLVAYLMARSSDLLATIALGNTIAAAGMIAVALSLSFSGAWALTGVLAGLFVLNLVAGEVLPKTLAVRRPETWALRVAKPLNLLLRISTPVSRVAQKLNTTILSSLIPENIKPQTALTEGDYQELLEIAAQGGALGQSEKEIILQIISLDRRTVRDVMRPRSQMAAIPDDLSIEEMVAAARIHRHRRLPMYDETPDTIVGVLNTRALLLDPQGDLADAIEFPSFVPETMNLLQLFISLQRQQRGLAIVLDEFGGTAGIVTLEDILEGIIGKIRHDRPHDGLLLEKLSPGKWRVAGVLRIDDFRREYPALGEIATVETMGGLMLTLTEVVPAPGEAVFFRGLKMTAVATDDRRIREVLIEVAKRTDVEKGAV
jgi:CBS domain containing-hemolysin-like protein